jgi:hypothetical protein
MTSLLVPGLPGSLVYPLRLDQRSCGFLDLILCVCRDAGEDQAQHGEAGKRQLRHLVVL